MNNSEDSGSPYISPDELVRITGKRRSSAQCKALAREGYKFETDAAGRPLVRVSECATSSTESLSLTMGLDEAARLTRCHGSTLRKMAARGEVPATKIGRAWLFSRRLLMDWIEARCQSAPVTQRRRSLPSLAERLAAKSRLQKAR